MKEIPGKLEKLDSKQRDLMVLAMRYTQMSLDNMSNEELAKVAHDYGLNVSTIDSPRQLLIDLDLDCGVLERDVTLWVEY